MLKTRRNSTYYSRTVLSRWSYHAFSVATGTSRKAIILRVEGTKPSRVAWSPFTGAGNLPRESPGRPAQSSQRNLPGEATFSDSWRCALANSCVRGSRRACCCRLTVSCPTGAGTPVQSGRCCLSPRSSLKEPDAVPPSGVRDPAARPRLLPPAPLRLRCPHLCHPLVTLPACRATALFSVLFCKIKSALL